MVKIMDSFSAGNMKMGIRRVAAVMILAGLAFAGPQGCAQFKMMTSGDEPVEMVLKDPPSYGVISNVTPAAMLGTGKFGAAIWS
jgi:hypothetical protein